jgi:hypothetical protein
MSSTKRDKFSGQPSTGLFEGQANCVFFSPALLEPRTGNEIEVESIGVTLKAGERYIPPSVDDTRLFLVGSLNLGRTNNLLFRTHFKTASIIGTIVPIIPPGPTVVFKIR